MPKRPQVPPFDPLTQQPEVEDLKKRLEELDNELAALSELDALRAREREAIVKHFKAKSTKARKMQLELEKKSNPTFQIAAQRVKEQSAPLHSSNKRPMNKSRNDMDYEDEYDDDDVPVQQQRKAIRSSSAAVAPAPKRPKAPAKKPVPQNLPHWLQKACKLIDDLEGLAASLYFRRPVDPVADNLPEYFDYVTEPMDLSTMRTKCENSQYANLDELLKDFQLIFFNCVTFNGPDSPVTADCRSLQKVWMSRINKMKGNDDAVGEKRGRGARSASGSGRAAKPAAAAKSLALVDLTWPEKELLMGYIGALPAEELSNVVQIVGELRALDGGDQEGGELELDFGELPTVTLRKLQDFVFGYRRQHGLEVTLLAPEPAAAPAAAAAAPVAAGADDVFMADEDDVVVTSPKPKKQRSQKVKKEDATPARTGGRAQPPKNQSDLKELAEKTKENTEQALKQLKNELKRMAGKVVDSDHVPAEDSGLALAANEYSLDPATLGVMPLDSDDSSSDTVSSDDEEGGDSRPVPPPPPQALSAEAVHIIPVGEEQGAEVVIEDTSGWRSQLVDEGQAASPGLAEAQGGEGGHGGGGGGDNGGAAGDDGLWEAFASKDAQQMELAKARKEHEEKLKRERELKEEELRKLEKEKRLEREEEERRRREEKEREEKEAQRQREEERLARKREREGGDEPRVDLTEQQRLMADFERRN